LNGCDLSKRKDLEGKNLDSAQLINANLSHTNLSRTNLIGADLSNVDLRKANFHKTNFSFCKLIKVKIFSNKKYQDPLLNILHEQGLNLVDAVFFKTVFHISHYYTLKALKIDLNNIIFVDDAGKKAYSPTELVV